MKRYLVMLLMCVLLMGMVVMPASAESTASRVDSYITVDAEGTAQVSLTVTLHLEAPDDTLSFPLPLTAKNITMNGAPARTNKTDSAIEVDLSGAMEGMVGDFTIQFGYTIPNTVTVTKVNDKDMLRLDLPMLNGFAYPINNMSFVITLPGNVTYKPTFHSVYRQESIDSDLEYNIRGNMISGATTVPLNDRDSLAMAMYVTTVMFPNVSTYVRVGNPELPYIIGFAVAALLYWLLFLRTAPLIRIRNVTAPEGINAGELGCHLTLAGGDLTMMVMHWAQMGYILIQLDGSRVLLHKRMDMGNERSQFEVKIYKSLFGSRRVVEATSMQYAKLHRKVAGVIPGERSLHKPNSGSMKLFRFLCCGAQAACGVCVAMNMVKIAAIQILLAILLAIFGAVSAWQIQEIAYRTHLRGKTRVYIGLMCMLMWIVLGLMCGEWIIPLCCTLGQLVMSYFAAYGGRRSDMGRHDAGLILGLRHYLKRISKEDLKRLQKTDPDYFFNLAPYALALGIIHPFAKNFGARKLDQCPYLMTRVHGKRTAEEWADMMAQTADLMDARQRKMEYEKWTNLLRRS